MKRTICLLVCFLFVIGATHAQRIALIGGPGTANVTEKNHVNGWDSAYKPYYSNRTGIHLGFLAEIPLSPDQRWQFQPGIIYQSKGRKFFRLNDSLNAAKTDTVLARKNTSINYIEFPLNISFKYPLSKTKDLIFSAGPYMALFYSGNESIETSFYWSSDFKQDDKKLETGTGENKIKTVDFGVNARVGIESSKLFVTAFMSRGLSNFHNASYKGSFRHRVAGVSIGFFLNKGGVIKRKIRDKDQDGIADEDDHCPDQPGTLLTNGCPDEDGDCIADKIDRCPQQPGTAKYAGCPIPDTDGDGVNDEEDKCIDLAGSPRYGGCPVPDTDGDGVNDDSDSCKDIAGNPEFNGCPIPDTDRDGVNDKEDKCPTEAGVASNDGCPDEHLQMVELVNLAARNIFYDPASDKISIVSYASLDDVGEILKNNPELRLEIEGHSDNTGQASFNLKLSQKRALAVKKYLTDLGIEGARLTANGFGQKLPIATNDTAEGRAQNRRVVLKLRK